MRFQTPLCMEDYCVILSQTHHIQREKKPEKELETTLVYSIGFCKTVMSKQDHTHFGGAS